MSYYRVELEMFYDIVYSLSSERRRLHTRLNTPAGGRSQDFEFIHTVLAIEYPLSLHSCGIIRLQIHTI